MLEVSSTDVIFDLKDDHLIPYKLEIKNTASAMLAYKIKTTNPGLFQVKPCKGILNGYQRETVEFCILDGPPINDRTLINEKFQIQAIKLNEKKSFAEIDQLFKTETVQMIKMATCVYKYQDGQKIPVFSDRLSVSRGNQGDQAEIVAKIRALDIEIMEKRMLREELFNKTPKKSSKIQDYFYLSCILGLTLLYEQTINLFTINLNHVSVFYNERAGITVLRNLEWYDNSDDQDGHQQIAWMMIVIPIIILFLPQIGNVYKGNFQNKILQKQSIDVTEAPNCKVKKQTRKVKTTRIKEQTKTKVKQAQTNEHSQEQSVKSQQLSEQAQNDEQKNQIDDSKLSFKHEQESQHQQVNIMELLNIIDRIPNACIRQFSEFTFLNRIKRRKILFSNNPIPIKLELYAQEALQYVYYLNTIVEDSMFNLMKEQNLNSNFRNQLSPDENEEIQTHIRYVIRELECMIPQYQRLLLKDVLYYYAYQISLVDQKHLYIAELPKYLNEIYLSAVLNIMLQDLAWKEMGIEEEQKQHLLKTFTNNCEILNLQFELDEKLRSIE